MNFYYVYIIKDILKMSTFNVKESSRIKMRITVIFLLLEEYKMAFLKTLDINIQLLIYNFVLVIDASFNETIQNSLET